MVNSEVNVIYFMAISFLFLQYFIFYLSFKKKRIKFHKVPFSKWVLYFRQNHSLFQLFYINSLFRMEFLIKDILVQSIDNSLRQQSVENNYFFSKLDLIQVIDFYLKATRDDYTNIVPL